MLSFGWLAFWCEWFSRGRDLDLLFVKLCRRIFVDLWFTWFWMVLRKPCWECFSYDWEWWNWKEQRSRLIPVVISQWTLPSADQFWWCICDFIRSHYLVLSGECWKYPCRFCFLFSCLCFLESPLNLIGLGFTVGSRYFQCPWLLLNRYCSSPRNDPDNAAKAAVQCVYAFVSRVCI